MISIKRFLEQKSSKNLGLEPDVAEALRQVARLLVDGIATHTVRGRPADFEELGRALHELGQKLDAPQSPPDLFSSSSGVTEALETYCGKTTQYFREEKEQIQAMVIMLSETVADVAGQSQSSGGRLQTIEKELELASGLSDLRAVRSGLESCLVALREASALQRTSSAATVQRLQGQVDKVQMRTSVDTKHVPFCRPEIDLLSALRDGPGKSVLNLYVAGFKLKRAELIAIRFGEAAMHQMLDTVGGLLKALLGPHDRLLRRQGASFVMLLNSTADAREIRNQLSRMVTSISIQPVEVGRKSALLAVGLDWMVFPQVEHASLEAVLAAVDAFLADPSGEISTAAARRA